MNKFAYLAIFSVFLIFSCTYNISMVHTEGTASDVIDTEQEARPETDANLNIPVKPL